MPRSVAHIAGSFLLIVAVGCDKPHSSAIGPSALASAQTEQGRLSVTGPESVAPGTTAQFRAVFTASDGTSQDVTDSSSWRSRDARVIAGGAPGAYTAGSAVGETDIVAAYHVFQVERHVFVLPNGTFALHGSVRDVTYPVPGARVSVTSGIGAGLTATTDSNGAYVVYGVAGDVALLATSDGYVPDSQTVNVGSNALEEDFALTLVDDRTDIAGSWRLVFTASDSCGSLPDEVRQRTYPLQVVQNGPVLRLTMTLPQSAWQNGPTIPLNGRIAASKVDFELPDDPIDGPYVYERLTSGQYFTLDGNADGVAADGAVSGTINGSIHVYTTWPGISCQASNHRFRLER